MLARTEKKANGKIENNTEKEEEINAPDKLKQFLWKEKIFFVRNVRCDVHYILVYTLCVYVSKICIVRCSICIGKSKFALHKNFIWNVVKAWSVRLFRLSKGYNFNWNSCFTSPYKYESARKNTQTELKREFFRSVDGPRGTFISFFPFQWREWDLMHHLKLILYPYTHIFIYEQVQPQSVGR